MLSREEIDRLFVWVHAQYPKFQEEPETREKWREGLSAFAVADAQRAARVVMTVRPKALTLKAFTIACRGGEQFLRKHLADGWEPKGKSRG